MAPADRSISTSVMLHVISVTDLLKVADSCVVVNETVKKSKASHVQPRKATCKYQSCMEETKKREEISAAERAHTKKNNHCCPFSSASALKGFGAGFIGGTSVERRVATYRPMLMCSSISGEDEEVGPV